jgi:putative SOS response-associated peptidase YedK
MAIGRQPYYITSARGPLLSMAGLWDCWKNIKTGATVISCTVIVTSANTLTRPIHDRMPVLLAADDVSAWLHGEAGIEVLKPATNESLRIWPVSRRVNRTDCSDDPGLIEPLSEASAHAAAGWR